jgi:Fe-S cluster assembly protein SufD
MAQSLDHYVAEYENARRTRSIDQPAWLVRARSDALNRFRALGFPTTRDEEWRFTSVATIADRAFALGDEVAADAGHSDVDRFRLSSRLSAEVVFVNGRYIPTLSNRSRLPAGTSIESLASALTSRADEIEPYLTRLASFERQAFTALNTAFLTDGVWIHIPPRVIVENPIHVLFISTSSGGPATMSHPRVLAVLGQGSQASIVESHAGQDSAAYFTNAVTEIVLGENAALEHYKVQQESAQAYHIGAIHVRAQRSANCTSHSISLGGSLVRNDVTAVLDGEGAECTLNGLYLADGNRHVDNHTTIDHAKPHCGSREVYKGVLADRARGVFNGKIIVRPDAQKTDAKQTNRTLLLSEDAQINTKPQLEIFANDVKCTHGAAVGQLDDEAVFYLRSRGLAESEARRLLIHAFAADVLNRIPLESVRAGAEQVLQQRLARVLATAA